MFRMWAFNAKTANMNSACHVDTSVFVGLMGVPHGTCMIVPLSSCWSDMSNHLKATLHNQRSVRDV